jgi:hypothetical protein
MPTVTLRGRKDGHRIARLVVEGSFSNPIRYGDLNGEPFEVTDEEFARLDRIYVLESADKPEDTDQAPPRLVAASEQDENPEKGGVK